MSFDPTTKLAKVREAMANGDWDLAIKTAAKFPSLGEYEKVIRRGRDALNNPRLYRQLGFDLSAIKHEAIAALKQKYSRSWEQVRKIRRSARTRAGGQHPSASS